MTQEREAKGRVWFGLGPTPLLEAQHVWFSQRGHPLEIRMSSEREKYHTWGATWEEEDFEPVSLTQIPGALVAFTEIASAVENLASQFQSVKVEVSELRAELESRPISRAATIHELGDDIVKLAIPIQIVIEEYAEEVVARFPEVEAFASAENEFEAIELLKADIAALYTDLASTPIEELGHAPIRWLRVLTSLIQK